MTLNLVFKLASGTEAGMGTLGRWVKSETI